MPDQIVFNQKIIFNKEDTKKLNETILFLKIDRDDNEKYVATLEVKSEIDKEPVIKTIVKNQAITIGQNLFQDLYRFAAYRRGGPHTRKIGDSFDITEQIQLERQVGIEIYETFLPGDIGKIFEDFFSLLMRSKINQLVLVIGSGIPEILNIPFELMRKDMASESFILSNDSFLLTHTIEAGLSDFDIKGVEPSAPPLRLLFVSALPVDLSEEERLLELEKEQEMLIEAVGDLVSERKVLVEFLDIATLDEIEKSLSKGQHHIVHFSGHGKHVEDSGGVLYLENDDGSTFAVTGEELAKRLKKYKSIKLVVLSACETARAETQGVAGALIANGIPAVLAMRYPVGDRAATCFTSKLYEGICAGKALCRSIFNARNAVLDDERKQMEELAKFGDLEDFTPDWMTPFLYLNQTINHLIDYSQKPSNTEYFFQKPSFRPVEGGKYVGYGFIGRRKEIIGLYNLFKKEIRSICIYGQGGVGKTTLAIRFADNFENGLYTIIQFRGELTEEKILTGLANRAKKKLGESIVEIINSPDFSPESKLNMLIEQYLSRYKVIVLFDNFEDNQVESKEKKIYQREIHSKTLKDFLGHLCENLKRSSYILFTTRYRFSEPVVEGFNLGEMRFSDSFKMINRFEHLLQLKTGEKREIHDKLGGHPRALELLEGYFKKENITWQGMSAGFKEVAEKEINHDLLLDMLWNRLNDTERRVLKAASVFRGMTVFKGLEKVTGLKPGNIKNILDSLNAFSLVYLEEGIFNVHRLTSAFVTLTKMKKSEIKKTHIFAAEYFDGIRNEEGEKNIEDALEARWHFMQAEEWNKTAELTCVMVDILNMRGYPKLSFDLLVEISEKNISKKNHAGVFLFLGILNSEFNQIEQALNHYKKAMKIFGKISDISGEAQVLHEIGIIHQVKGDFMQALKHFEKSVEIKEKIGDMPGISRSLYHIGIIHQAKNECEQALRQYEKSMEISEKIEDVKGILNNLHQIGTIYQYKGDYELALHNYKEAMKMREKIGDISGTALSLGQMGRLYSETKDYTNALKLFIAAFLIFEELDSPDVNKARYDILNVKRTIAGEQFSEILSEFNLQPDVFDKTEKEEEQEFYEVLFNITSQAVNAKEKNSNEKGHISKIINDALEQIPGNAPEQEGLIAYFKMLLAYLAGEDHNKYKEKIPPELYELFEKVLKDVTGSG